MISIKDYHKILRDLNLTEKDGHLLLPEGYKKDTPVKIAKELFLALGDMRAENSNFKLYKKKGFCNYPNCVSPQCYHFHINESIKNSTLDKEDVIDLANSMDLKEIESMGAKKYLDFYNSTQPDILKLNMSDFKIILAYMKGNKYDS